MKILLVTEAAGGGTGRHVLDLAGDLLVRGNEVHLVYSPVRADRAFVAGLARLGVSKRGFLYHAISITRELSFADFRSYMELSRYVHRHRPFDIVHAHSTKAGFLARLLVHRGGARLVYTPHGLLTLDPELRGVRRCAVCVLESALAGLCDAVLAVSANERRSAISTGISASKLITIPNGADAQGGSRETIRAEWGLSADTVCLGWVGRLAESKEPGEMLRSFAQLKRNARVPVRLAMIGRGPLERNLRLQARDLRISSDVMFLGEVDAKSYMPAMDILAHTSRFEAFCYVHLEALSAGVPVVTRVGIEELITHGVTGYICDPWDAVAFAVYLQQLVEDPGRRNAMSMAARERASHFTLARMTNQIAALYQRLCSSSDSSPVISAACETLPTNSHPR